MTGIADILAARRRRALAQRDGRVMEFYKRNPQIMELKEERLARSRALLGEMLRMSPEEVAAAQREIQEMSEAEDRAIEATGVGPDFFTPDYTCPDCGDTGFVDGVSCHCRNDLLLEQRYQMSAVQQRIAQENFETFDLSLFRRDRQAGEELSPYENMKEIRDALEQDYVPGFASDSPNLYFYGPTGTGKTFLLNAIVKGVLDRGQQVFYQTAPELLDFLSTYSFTYQNERTPADVARRDFAYSCDLLALDDLGAEYTTEKMTAELFELLNSRIVAQRPTIISSNLELTELESRYNARIASRIAGEFAPFYLYGADLRRRI
ncbi:MAG: ATP-binding protein [Peptoniphilaceae bacterium]|nr:ATP-binding protein [Peptoniphilaceae bacterium]MDY6085762.1 ATP-binding protein [Peptoniphilaceae bacterium]